MYTVNFDVATYYDSEQNPPWRVTIEYDNPENENEKVVMETGYETEQERDWFLARFAEHSD